MATGTLISLGIYFAVMIAIGVYAWRKSTSTSDGYLLGGRDLGPAVTALSAGASDMSGWLLMGLPGAIFLTGVSQAWIGIGLVVGAYLNYRLVAPRLRTYTELAGDAITVPDFLEQRFHDRKHVLRIISALVIIVFFTLYTSSGMVAGGKLAASALGMDYATGVVVTAGVVVLYVVMGGFLAVSLTDFVQGCLMFIALIAVPVTAYSLLGGDFTAMIATAETNRGLASGALSDLVAGVAPMAILSAAAWGLGYFGQPHIVVQFMAIRSVKDLPVARRINMTWMIGGLIGAIATGYIGAAWFAQDAYALKDSETVFIMMSRILFHPLVYGFILAAILAAIMSTISSQLLVTSSSLAEDIYHTIRGGSDSEDPERVSEKELVLVSRIAVVGVAIFAGLLAMDPQNSILGLVSNAWAGFGAAFGPVLLFSLLWKRTTRMGALAGMIVGAVSVGTWIALGWSDWLYEIVPGFILASIAVWLVSRLTPPPGPDIEREFDEAAAAARGA